MNEVIRKVERRDDAIVVHAFGEIDLQHSPGFHQALVGLCAEQPKRLIVHLSEVTFIDSSGVGSLVDIFRRMNGQGGELVLHSPSQRVRSVLEITRLNRFFTIVGSGEEVQD